MMIESTNITHGHTIASNGEALGYLVSLKSKFVGDNAAINSFQFRAITASNTEILSSGDGHDAGTSTVSIVPKKRPPLMHQSGVKITTGTTGIPFATATYGSEQRPVASVALLLKPVSGTVRISRGALNLSITSAGAVTYTGAQTLYVNGSVVTTGTTIDFPFPRLLVIAYSAATNEGVSVKASTGSATFYLQHVAVSGRVLDATAAATFTQMYYRKPSTVSVLTDSALSASPGDTTVTVPPTWIEV